MATQQEDPGLLEQAVAYIVDSVVDYIANIVNRIANAISSAFAPIVDYIAGLVNSVRNYLSHAIDSLVSYMHELVSYVTTVISDAINSVYQWVSQAIDSLTNTVNSIADAAYAYLGELYDAVANQVQNVYDGVVAYLDKILANFGTSIEEVVNSVRQYFVDIYDKVASSVSDVLATGSAVVSSIRQAIEQFVTEVVDVVGSSLRDLLDTIAQLPDEIQALAGDLVQSAKDNIGDPLTQMWENLYGYINEHLTGANGADADRFRATVENIATGQVLVGETREDFAQLFRQFFPNSPVSNYIFSLLIGFGVLFQTYSGIAAANSRIITQEFNASFPSQILNVADSVSAYRRGRIDRGEMMQNIAREGYNPSDIAAIETVLQKYPELQELSSWYTRGLINEGEFEQYLRGHGFDDTAIAAFKVNAFFIPPAGDLITMAVREAFSPEIAERFGQYEDYPEEFAKYAKQSGLGEEWSRRYWAAHWALPSVQMGYEMLHRSVITQDDLNLLLKAADVMPFWRDKLIAISYSPYTRVDVRRMHALGILDEEEVKRAYLDLGYDDEKATNMLRFTVEYNQKAADASANELVGLQRASIVKFYTSGILKRDEAVQLLIEIGFTDWVAELYLTQADLEQELSDRTEAINLIVDKAKAGLVTYEQANDELVALGLESAEVQRALVQIQRARTQATKLPSRADLDKMVKLQIIGQKEYVDTMMLLGYSELWVGRYFQMATRA